MSNSSPTDARKLAHRLRMLALGPWGPSRAAVPGALLDAALMLDTLTVSTSMNQHWLEQMRREQACIAAIHRRPWWRKGILLRRPWGHRRVPLRSLRRFWGWLTTTHDCADPAVACSCSGGFRFPHRGDT